jgi:hypothetical protein
MNLVSTLNHQFRWASTLLSAFSILSPRFGQGSDRNGTPTLSGADAAPTQVQDDKYDINLLLSSGHQEISIAGSTAGKSSELSSS